MKNSDMLFTTMKGKFVETIYEEDGLYTTRELKGVDYSTLLDYAAEKDLRIQNRQNPKMQQEIRKEEMAQKVAVYHDREGRITIVDKALPKKADGIMNTKQGDPKMNELAWKLFDAAGDLLNKIYTTPGVEDKMRTEALDVNLAMQEMVSYFDR